MKYPNRVNPLLKIKDYDDWPYKIIYASNGLSESTVLSHLNDFYVDNPQIPIYRRPDIIHVAGKYVIIRIKSGMSVINNNDKSIQEIEIGNYHSITTNSDLQAMVWIIDELQKKATASSQIIYRYSEIINKINEIL